VLVYRLRKYWDSLSDGNQRDFVDKRRIVNNRRVDAATFEKDADVDVDFTGKKIYSFVLEKPTVLASLLDKVEQHRTKKLPPLRLEQTTPVCTKFFLHILHRSTGWLYAHTVPTSKRFAVPGARSLEARRFPVQSTPKVFTRDQPKTADVLVWMKQESELHLLLSNLDGTVLPYHW
jgi:hypothetical protein